MRLMQTRREFMTRDQVAETWFREEYEPVTEMMREAGLCGRGSETEAYARVVSLRYLLLRTHAWNDEVIERLREELARPADDEDTFVHRLRQDLAEPQGAREPRSALERRAPQEPRSGAGSHSWSSPSSLGSRLAETSSPTSISSPVSASAPSRRSTTPGLRPTSEVVIVQSDTLTIDDPEFRAAIQDVTGRLSELQYVENVDLAARPATPRSPLTATPRSSTSRSPATRSRPGIASMPASPRPPRSRPSTRTCSSSSSATRAPTRRSTRPSPSDLGKAGDALAPGHADHPRSSPSARWSPPGVPLLLGLTAVIAALALVSIPSQLLPGRQQRPRGDPADRARGRASTTRSSTCGASARSAPPGASERAALEVAAATSGRAVLISGLTVIVAMAGMFLSGDKTFISFAEGTILVVAIAMFASLTVLPAMLAWLGDRVEKGRIPFLGGRRGRPASRASGRRLIDRVMRRPLARRSRSPAALLVALAIPALQHEDAWSAASTTCPRTSP